MAKQVSAVVIALSAPDCLKAAAISIHSIYSWCVLLIEPAMRVGKVTRPERVTPSVPLHTTFLLHLTLTLFFPASFLCLALPMMWSPSSGSLMGKVNVDARAAYTNSTPSPFSFLPHLSPSPPALCPHATFSALLSPLSLCNQSRALTWWWLKGLLLCQSDCHLAPSVCCSGSPALSQWAGITPGAHLLYRRLMLHSWRLVQALKCFYSTWLNRL